MRKLLFAAAALAGLSALAGCGNGGSAGSSSSSLEVAPPPAQTPAPEPKPTTEAAAVSGADGAYGMPRSPVPYDQLTAYEQQRRSDGRALDEEPQPNAKRRNPDSVFY